MKQIQVKKGDILQASGELNSKIYHVTAGLLRSYTIDKKGKEHIFMFAPEGWIIADYVPPDTPTMLFIDALEDATVGVREKIIEQEADTIRFIKRIEVLQRRVIQLMSATALERYEHFIETYPDISKRIPQRMIASYLGVTPEALSKVKNERASNKGS